MTLKDFLPPVLLSLSGRIAKSLRPPDPDELFGGDDTLFKNVVSGVGTYFEYGVGASTDWVLHNTGAEVFAVDTSSEWVTLVRARNAFAAERLHIEHIDVGPLGNWGRPKTYAKRASFQRYIESPCRTGVVPGLVLIDGRFRVACFLQTPMSAPAGTRIIFDDYADKPHYHLVEEFVTPTDSCGRQRLFVIPERVDLELVRRTCAQFTFVLE